jgi:hypothetical protein
MSGLKPGPISEATTPDTMTPDTMTPDATTQNATAPEAATPNALAIQLAHRDDKANAD